LNSGFCIQEITGFDKSDFKGIFSIYPKLDQLGNKILINTHEIS